MKVKYDKEADILVVKFSNESIEESDEERPGMIFDYDANGNIVSIEILDASQRNINPDAIELSVVRT